MITLLLVDDQISVRKGLRMRFALETDIHIIGEACDAEAANKLARELQPDVALLDIAMPGIDGIAAIGMLRKAAPECAVIILSLHDDNATRARAASAGAFAFIAKHEPDTTLLEAIRRAGAHCTPA